MSAHQVCSWIRDNFFEMYKANCARALCNFYELHKTSSVYAFFKTLTHDPFEVIEESCIVHGASVMRSSIREYYDFTQLFNCSPSIAHSKMKDQIFALLGSIYIQIGIESYFNYNNHSMFVHSSRYNNPLAFVDNNAFYMTGNGGGWYDGVLQFPINKYFKLVCNSVDYDEYATCALDELDKMIMGVLKSDKSPRADNINFEMSMSILDKLKHHVRNILLNGCKSESYNLSKNRSILLDHGHGVSTRYRTW